MLRYVAVLLGLSAFLLLDLSAYAGWAFKALAETSLFGRAPVLFSWLIMGVPAYGMLALANARSRARTLRTWTVVALLASSVVSVMSVDLRQGLFGSSPLQEFLLWRLPFHVPDATATVLKFLAWVGLVVALGAAYLQLAPRLLNTDLNRPWPTKRLYFGVFMLIHSCLTQIDSEMFSLVGLSRWDSAPAWTMLLIAVFGSRELVGRVLLDRVALPVRGVNLLFLGGLAKIVLGTAWLAVVATIFKSLGGDKAGGAAAMGVLFWSLLLTARFAYVLWIPEALLLLGALRLFANLNSGDEELPMDSTQKIEARPGGLPPQLVRYGAIAAFCVLVVTGVHYKSKSDEAAANALLQEQAQQQQAELQRRQEAVLAQQRADEQARIAAQQAQAARSFIPCSLPGVWGYESDGGKTARARLEEDGSYSLQIKGESGTPESGHWGIVMRDGVAAMQWKRERLAGRAAAEPTPIEDIAPIKSAGNADTFTLTESNGSITIWQRMSSVVPSGGCEKWKLP